LKCSGSPSISSDDLEESWRSLFAVAEFYSGLSRGFAASLDYPYPGTVEENVMRYVTEMRDI
jgi:hypothetical protein